MEINEDFLEIIEILGRAEGAADLASIFLNENGVLHAKLNEDIVESSGSQWRLNQFSFKILGL